MSLENNNKIITKMDNLYKKNNIPNIIFHGDYLSGKKTMLEYLLKKVYKNRDDFIKYVLIINCSHGKGNIKFIRENLKFFANTICNNKDIFKSIILLNADKLTIDAQSALRRSIEIYNHSTRFFIVVDNKYKLLKPILSRFSEIHCNENINLINNIDKYNYESKKLLILQKFLNKHATIINNNSFDVIITELFKQTDYLYNDAYSADLLIKYIENKLDDNFNKYYFLFVINICKKEIRNESLLILFCLNYIYFRNNINLKNISFI